MDKLLRMCGAWLAAHPERDADYQPLSAPQPQARRRSVAAAAGGYGRSRGGPDAATPEPARERQPALAAQRLSSVLAVLKGSGAKRVLDLGCGEGRLLQALLDEPAFEEIVGLDVSVRELERAKARLHDDCLRPMRQQRIRLLHGSLLYRDERIEGFDAAAAVEVVEHLDSRAAAGVRAGVVRLRPPRHGGPYHAQRRLQPGSTLILNQRGPWSGAQGTRRSLPKPGPWSGAQGTRRSLSKPGPWSEAQGTRRSLYKHVCGTTITASSGRGPSCRAWARGGGRNGYRCSCCRGSDGGPGAGPADADGGVHRGPEPHQKLPLPELSLVVLVGPSSSGKSSFAASHFLPTEVISSDGCRGLVADDENDLNATGEAFDLLHFRRRPAAGGAASWR